MRKKKINIIIFLLLVEITSLFLMYKSYGNKTIDTLQRVETRIINKVEKKKYSMWKRTSTTSNDYVEITTIPTGYYKLNTTRTNCEDLNGDSVNYIPTYSNGKVTVTSSNTIFCWLYFDNYFDGEGTEANPYQIKIIENLVDLSILTNEGNTFEGEYFAMAKSLNFASSSSYGDSTRIDYGDINEDNTTEGLLTELTRVTGKGFTPIGTVDNSFYGNFDGANYTLSNIYINNSTLPAVGLFGSLNGASLENLELTGTVKTTSGANTGAFSGRAWGTTSFSDLTNRVTVTSTSSSSAVAGIVGIVNGNSSVTDCSNYGAISGGNSTSGIVGVNYTSSTLTVANCQNNGTITSALGVYTGGIVARDNDASSETIINNCVNNNSVKNNIPDGTTAYFGGIMGLAHGGLQINNSSNIHDIGSDIVDSSNVKYIGGVLGVSYSAAEVTLNNCHNTGLITGGSIVGGVLGLNRKSTIINECYNTGNISTTSNYSSTIVGGVVGYNYANSNSGNSKLIILNSYNEGTINSPKTAGGVIAATAAANSSNNATSMVINCYNTGGITGTTYARGISGNDGYGITRINNVYNYGTITSSTVHGVSSHSGTALYLDNAYYLTGVTGAPSTATVYGTPVALTSNQISNQANYNGQPFVSTLNSNVTGITLSNYDASLAEYGLLSWKHDTTKGYPVFSEEVIATISATKKTAGTAVASDTWSNEGLNYILSAPAGATIYYCKDTNNTCSPGTTTTSGSSITSYNTVTGTYYIRYKTISNGVSSSVRSYIAKVDITPPTINYTLTANGVTYTGGWTKYNVNPHLTFSDDLSGVKANTLQYGYNGTNWLDTNNTSTISYDGNWGPNDNNMGYYKICDVAGNCNDISFVMKIDQGKPSKPTYVAKFASDNSNYTSGNWTNHQVNTIISSVDSKSGVTSMYYSTDKSTWVSLGLSVSNGISKSGTTYSGTEPWGVRERDNTYYFKVIDAAGNESDPSDAFTIRYDLTPPSKPTYVGKHTSDNSAYTSGTWTNNQVYTTLSSTDATSGVTEFYYSTNQTNWVKLNLYYSNGISKSGTTYSGNEAWTVADGRNDTFYFKVKDAAGNESVVSDAFNIKYDTTKPSKPTINGYYYSNNSAYTSGTWATGQIYTTITSTDANAGVTDMYYSYDKSTWNKLYFSKSDGIVKSGTTYSGQEPWGYRDRNDTFYVKAVDSAGNTSDISNGFNVKYDLTKPSKPTVTAKFSSNNSAYTSGNWAKSEVYTIISSSDSGVGVSEMYYSFDQNTWSKLNFAKSNGISQSGTTYSGSEAWTVYNNRNQTIYFKAVDARGNTSDVSNGFTIRYDTVAPTYSFSSINSSNQVTVTCNDDHSPTGGKTVTLSGSSYTVSGTCSDAASNTTSYSKTYTYSRVSACGVQTAAVCTKSCVVTDYVSRTSRNMFVCTTNSSGTCSGTAVSSAATSTCNSVYGTRGSYNTGSNTDIYVTCNNACPSGYGPSTYADQCEKNRTTTCSCTQGTSGCTCTDPVYYACWH